MNIKTLLSSAALAAAVVLPATAQDLGQQFVQAAGQAAGQAVGQAVGQAIAEAITPDPAKAPADQAPAAFSFEERELLRSVADDVRAALAKAGLPGALPVSTLRIQGDRERYLEGLLKNAVTGAGLNYVEGRTDPMWNEIVAEIKWDDLKDDLLDEATLTKFGRLQAARLLVYGRLIVDADKKGRPRAELILHASSTETKQHLWGEVFFRVKKRGGEPIPREPAVYIQESVASLLTARVHAFVGDNLNRVLALRLIPISEDALVKGGFQVVETNETDILLRLEPMMDVKDRTADFVVFRGRVPVSAVLPAYGNRNLGTGQIEKTGDLVQDNDPALSSLVSKIEQPLRDWIAQHVTPEACGLRVENVTVSYRDYEPEETSARITQFCDAAAALKGAGDARGVVSCTLAQRLDTGNKAVYRVVYTAGSFPNGFLHALIAANPGLELVPELAK